MDFIDDFMARYVREYDYFEHAARTVKERLDRDLQEAGVRSMITHRAKSTIRLEAKCRQRNIEKPYSSVANIYENIVDLAGVRVALYFPGQAELVGNRIKSLFKVVKEKTFPEEPLQKSGEKRFEGYSAVHYHVRLREEDLSDSEKRYATAKVEIQVASVLMHGWAEVEHDLVYKPHGQVLSAEEYALLDHLNGLVITGEGLLQSLQLAGDNRIAQRAREFSNHYELAAHLLSQPIVAKDEPVTQSGLGRVDLLFDFLNHLRLVTPEDLDPYLDSLHGNLESRPLAEQVSDALMVEDGTRYEVYQKLSKRRSASEEDSSQYHARGRFLTSWITLENLARTLVPSPDTIQKQRRILPADRALSEAGLVDEMQRKRLDRLRRMRNQLVHGIEIPPAAQLNDAAEQIDAIAQELREQNPMNPEGGLGVMP